MQVGSMFISNCNNILHVSDAIIAVTNKHTAKLHHVGFLYILTYDARKIKHKITNVSSSIKIKTIERPMNEDDRHMDFRFIVFIICYFYRVWQKSLTVFKSRYIENRQAFLLHPVLYVLEVFRCYRIILNSRRGTFET
jgi:hypothetical protein